ncbi:MAG: alpha/beta hydrolase [Pirellulaceae bacterium]
MLCRYSPTTTRRTLASSLCCYCAVFGALLAMPGFAAADEVEVELWKEVPGQIAAEGEERDTSGPDGRDVQGKPVVRLGHVSIPMVTVFPAPQETNTGAAVIVCPGGGYNILAYDLEGTEVCEWLNSIGVTGVLLKYRVPRPKKTGIDPETKLPIGPLMDAQRSVSLVRSRAKEWNINPDRIGVLGFSAGGNLAARTSTRFRERAYEAVDSIDEVSCRPDFSILIYPAYFYREQDELLSPAVEVDKQTPPMFLTMAFDDRVGPENILRMGLALKKVDVPAEVHLYPTGGHGYGLRPSEHEATTWPERCAAWMKASGWLER